MVDLRRVLTDIAKAVVDDPEQGTVTETVEGDNVMFELHVAEDDMGMIIGKHGKIARALRSVVKAAAKIADKKVTVEIK